MNTVDVERLRQIKTLPSLVKFLRDELDWPVEADEIDELFFDYTAEELGLDNKYAKMVKEIKQIRPLDSKQPWGVFWVNFEKKRLPMVVLRRILGNLVIKRRASARKTDRPSWHLNDLLFISSYGEEEHRTISFAHFAEDPNTDQLPVLRVLGWDDRKSIMNLDRVGNRLHSHLRWPDDSKAADAWRKSWSEAFTDRYREAIRSADELIPRLAELAAGVRVRVHDVLHAEIERGPMRRLFKAVQKLLIHDMDEDRFADMYAQTVAYGLLSARFSRQADITPQNLVQLTAVSNPFLENLLENLFRLNRGKFHFDVDEVGINDVLDLLRNTNIEAIKAAFSDKNPAEDPVIRFYEGFLKQYDPQQRIQRGVFFTPRPVVSYIVRSIHELIQTEFGLEDGLASTATWADMKNRFTELTIPKGAKPDDPFICILDPAIGTGTFLFECIEVIERTMKDKWCCELGKNRWDDPEIVKRWLAYVPRYLLPRLYGYELMMAPYSIAHLKLALKLGETGYQFQEDDRLHIYLTNSLDPPSELADLQLADLFTALATEAQEVNKIKANKRFTIVIGNPPYSGEGMNKGEWIRSLIDTYMYVDGAHLGEKGKKNWLQDDYVKFIRYAQFELDKTKLGILGFINNHSFLDNPTFRGMRYSLLGSFPRIHVLDLHGNSKKKERCPDDTLDENVFDIQQGVSVSFFRRTPEKQETRAVAHAHLWGLRDSTSKITPGGKYGWLAEHSYPSTDWMKLSPNSPFYLFVPQDTDLRREYEDYWKLTDVMPHYGAGIITSRDHFVIDFEDAPLLKRLELFRDSNVSDEWIRTNLEVKDNSMWSMAEARKDFRKHPIRKELLVNLLYRPFDNRRIYFETNVVFNMRIQVMRHMLAGRNLGLLTARSNKSPTPDHFFCSKLIVETKCGESTTQSSFFPLFLYPQDSALSFKQELRVNLSPQFLAAVKGVLGIRIENPKDGKVEDLFHYAYAVFHSPEYRRRYAEFMKMDFPRLPLTSSLDLFSALVKLGGELVALHLMESPKLVRSITKWKGAKPSGQVEKVSYVDKTVWIDKGKTEGFSGVPEEVWQFHIGGYQVCEKWLKDRKKAGRKLSAEDIEHYHKIVVAINETIKIMNQIDEVIEAHGGWPDAFILDQS